MILSVNMQSLALQSADNIVFEYPVHITQLASEWYEQTNKFSDDGWQRDRYEGERKRGEYNIHYEYKNVVFCWLFGFYGISTFVDYLMPNPFLYK